MSKAIIWILVTAFALALGALGYLAAANWQDEPLSETSRRALVYIQPIGNQVNGNGHVLLAGLDAPAPEKPKADAVEPARQLGLKILQREQERFKWNERFGSFDGPKSPAPIKVDKPITPEQVLPSELHCKPEQPDCIAWYVQNRKAISAPDPARRAALARVAAIANAPQYANIFPIYQGDQTYYTNLLRHAVTLQLAQASLLWNDKAYDKALDQVELLEKLRQRLARSDSLSLSAMATSWLNKACTQWISQVLTREGKKLRPQDAERLQKLLDAPRLTVRDGLHGEMVYFASVNASLGTFLTFPEPDANAAQTKTDEQAKTDAEADAEPRRARPSAQSLPARRYISSLLYLPHQSTNIATEQFGLTMALADVPTTEFDKALESTNEQRKALNAKRDSWFGARNIVGQKLMDNAVEWDTSYVDTIRREIDSSGYRRLVQLQLLAIQQNQAPDSMPGWLAQSALALRNPYDGKPMQWDAAKRSLVFEGRVKRRADDEGSKFYRIELR